MDMRRTVRAIGEGPRSMFRLLFHNNALGNHLSRAKWWLLSLYYAPRDKDILGNIETFCMFIGIGRSGHTLVASLIDAHPNAIISDEANAYNFIGRGFSREQLFSILLQSSRKSAKRARLRGTYSYLVPNQWQGSFQKLIVIGDKKGIVMGKQIESDPGFLERVKSVTSANIRFINVVRNPFDNITTLAKRNKSSLAEATEKYFLIMKTNGSIKKMLGKAVLDVRHEDVIKNPKKELSRICNFLGLKATEEYLEDCASIVYKKPHKSRNEAPWTPELIKEVEERMEKIPFLKGYSYDN